MDMIKSPYSGFLMCKSYAQSWFHGKIKWYGSSCDTTLTPEEIVEIALNYKETDKRK